MKRILPFLAMILLMPSMVSATEYYVDCSASSNGDGSFSNPWNTVGAVNNYNFNTGDDVYLKVNTRCSCRDSNTGSNCIGIDWNGTSEDRVIIGAYYGENQFGLNGNNMPVIDGEEFTEPGNEYAAGIKAENCEYITIRDLRIEDLKSYSISAKYSNNIITDNVYTYRTWASSIVYAQTSYGEIKNCIVEKQSIGPGAGAGIVAINQFSSSRETKNITIANNIVFESHEGIGLYKGTSYCIVENNTIYDFETYGYYLAGYSHHNIIRNNIAYTSNQRDPEYIGIAIGCETPTCEGSYYAAPGIVCSDYNEVYNNLIANFEHGIRLTVEPGCEDLGIYPVGNKFYNNIVVDCTNNLHFHEAGTGNEVRNTISYTDSDGSRHIYPSINDDVLFDNNLFDDSAGITGTNAANNAVFGDPLLTKTTGWRSIAPGTADPDWWKIQEGSPAIDQGLDLGSPYNTDFLGVTRPQGEGWDIGAFEYSSGLQTCSSLGGAGCCILPETCPGADLGTSSDCSGICCDQACQAPLTCQSEGFDCCDSCVLGTEQSSYDGDCSGIQVCCDECAASGIPRYAAVKTPATPVIDGDVSEFDSADAITLTEFTSGSSGTYKLMWDSDALYIAAQVTDTQLSAAYTERDDRIWNDDAVELFFDTLNDKGASQQPDDYKFFVNVLNVHTDSNEGDRTWNATYTSGVTASGTVNQAGDTDTGYTIEVAIPWSEWTGSPPVHGEIWGFDLALRERNDSGEPLHAIWANTDGDSNNNPDGWGEMLFTVRADSSRDGCIEEHELIPFIDLWKYDSTAYPMMEVMEAVTLWSRGTGCS